MDDAPLVCRFEPGRHLLRDAHRLLEAKARGLRGKSIRQGLALDELENERLGGAHFLQSVERGDIGMVQCREDLCLACEARLARRVERESRGQILSATSLCRRWSWLIHVAHAACPDGRDHLVGTDAVTGR